MRRILNPQALPAHILRDVEAYIKVNNIRAEVHELTAREAFEYYLHWNGIINWTDQITNAIDSIRAAEQSQRILDNTQNLIRKD